MWKPIIVASWIGLLILPEAASAWNKPGHETVAAIAYLSLSPEARDRIDALLRHHPDFSLLSNGLSEDDSQFGLKVAMRAAKWPDDIRTDSRFFDDTNPNATATPLLPGFPDMMRHRPWHFIAQGFSIDGTPTQTGTGPGALTQIIALQSSLSNPAISDSTKAYNLSWLLHLVGDIHQPLHCISRFSSRHTDGDGGGNAFRLTGDDSNLHTFWDDVLTPEQSFSRLIDLAQTLMGEVKRDVAEVAIAADPEVSVRHWVDESVALTKYVVYTVGTEESNPIRVPRSYRRLAKSIARHRAAIAGYRLGELLNQRLAAPNPTPAPDA